MTQGDRFAFVDPGQKQTLEDIHDAIAVATGDLGLLPGVAFQARVAQLAQLNSAHQTVSSGPYAGPDVIKALSCSTQLSYMGLVVRKPVFGVSDLVRHKPGCTATEDG